jgi:hypothetical protein
LQPIIHKVCHRLAPGQAMLYTTAGRLVVINSVITLTTICAAIATSLPVWLLHLFDKRIMAFF